MTPEQGRALDRRLTVPPYDCDEDGHAWQWLDQDEDGTNYYRCRQCGEECEG
ncbi:hypothetical protein MAJJADAN_00003 [Pseudomonas phage Amjad_SA]|nr:hypothetical protein MAJJADAN_00003 [Pseudomonas phage Amjad_SA]